MWPILPQGHGWQDLCIRLRDIAVYQIYKLWASRFQRRIFLKFPYYKSMETLDPQGGVSLDPRGMAGRISVRDR